MNGVPVVIALVGPMLLHESCLLILPQQTEKKDGTTEPQGQLLPEQKYFT